MAVVLLQMGGPASTAEIRPFLENLFADPDIIQWPRPLGAFQNSLARLIAKRRAPRMAPRYQAIGGGSPILRLTRAQAENLARELAARGRAESVHVAMRYTEPRAGPLAQRLRDEAEVTLLTLYPHWSRATTGSSVADFAAAWKEAGGRGRLQAVRSWGEHPSYVDLVAQQAEEAVQRLRKESGGPVHLVFSAHGLPQRYVDRGDPYPQEVAATARLVAARAGADSWTLTYQSAIGPVEWLRPYTDEHLATLPERGVKAVCCVPLGFVSDHIETLYDIDITFASVAKNLGLAWTRTSSFNEDPAFGRVLADVVRDSPKEEIA